MNEHKVHILIADDHDVVREGLEAILETQSDMVLVGRAADGAEAIALAKRLQPDVILMDLVMPHKDGVTAITEIRRDNPQSKILVLTSFADDERVFPAIKAGALGYLLKDTPRQGLLQAIRDVAAGQAHLHPSIALKVMHELDAPSPLPPTVEPLTPRELETLQLIARGLTNEAIAAELVIQESTVAKHVSNILAKLHLANRTQAALYALRQGWASLKD